jgi:Pin2-interacting protein X1
MTPRNSNVLVTKKTLSNLGSRIDESKGSTISSFAKKQMEKMGWMEGQGLGKNNDGLTNHIKVIKKEENTGLGLEKSSLETEFVNENWWHRDFADNLSKLKLKGVKIIKSKKNSKRKLKEIEDIPSYEDLFQATGGARLGMRARANQKGKLKRTEDISS